MFGFVIGTLSLLGLIKVWRWGRYGRHGWGRSFGPRRWMMRRLFEHLDTTPGQEKVIASALVDAERKLVAAREELFKSRGALGKAVRGEHFDGAAVDAAFDTQQAAVDELKKTVREGLLAIHEALNPEQRVRLGELLEFGPSRVHGGCGSGRFHHGHGYRHGGGEASAVNL
ncbi:MAG: periplasmic heavy metal sensor [Myxococcales bacterium]|nr:periplasmic heavy metal sensor [Myxococcales bacterium]